MFLRLNNSSIKANNNKPEMLSVHNLTFVWQGSTVVLLQLGRKRSEGCGSESRVWSKLVCATFTVVNVERLWRQTKVTGGVLEARSSAENPLTWSGKMSGNESAPQKELCTQGQLDQVDLWLCPLVQNKTPLECFVPLLWHHITAMRTRRGLLGHRCRRTVWKWCKTKAEGRRPWI